MTDAERIDQLEADNKRLTSRLQCMEDVLRNLRLAFVRHAQGRPGWPGPPGDAPPACTQAGAAGSEYASHE